MIHHYGDLQIDLSRSRVQRDHDEFPLRPRARALLRFLIDNSERVVAKAEIIDQVWEGRVISDSALATAVHEVRAALGDTDDKPRLILTYYGRGLQFVPPFEAAGEALPTLPPKDRASTIAVRSFECLSDEPALAHQAQALSDDIVTMAAKFRDLRVVSQDSTRQLVANGVTVKEAGLQLGAHFVVGGSMRPIGAGLRISAHLIETVTETHVWADRYDLPDREFSDRYEDTIRHMVNSLVSAGNDYEVARIAHLPLTEMTAFQCNLRGRMLVYTLQPEAQAEAIALLERALELDPGYADVYASLSHALINRERRDAATASHPRSVARPSEQRLRARELARQAIALDHSAPFAWAVLSRSHYGLGEIDDATSAAQKAKELNPHLSWAHIMLGWCYWMTDRGDDALQAFDDALMSSPRDIYRWNAMSGRAMALVSIEQYHEAISWSRRAQLDPNADHLAYCSEICALGLLGRTAEGAAAIERAMRSVPEFGHELLNYDLPIPDKTIRERVHRGLALAGVK